MKGIKNFMRVVHRYLGYFMAGIMAVYALSGMVLVYRDTDFLKKEVLVKKLVAINLDAEQLGKELKIKNLEFAKKNADTAFFKNGWYHSANGQVQFSKKELPYIVDKMAKLHKSKSGDAFSALNVLFGFSLFFFVLSSFWMFPPKSKIFKKGMLFALLGLVLAILLLFM